MRKAGATARAMLVAAAASDGGSAERDHRHAASHAAEHRTRDIRRTRAKAAAMPPPANVTLKDPELHADRQPVPRVDSVAKSNGTAQFTIDVYRPDMLTAVVAHPPRFGATVESFDATRRRAIQGVVDVVQIPRRRRGAGRQRLAGDAGPRGAERRVGRERRRKARHAELIAEYRALARTAGRVRARTATPRGDRRRRANALEALYEFPYLAHAPMEPMDCVVELRAPDACEIWTGAQFQTVDQGRREGAGRQAGAGEIHTLLAGGSFGRRATRRPTTSSEAERSRRRSTDARRSS